jgi:tRNA 2-selenouridine synthase
MVKQLLLTDFLQDSENSLVIDVRTPAEFEQGHIIGASNIPLFTNDERAQVGTCYKQQGRQAAILLGFELIGGRWADYVRKVEDLIGMHGDENKETNEEMIDHAEPIQKSKKVFVHCWRGGMRSAAMAWALSMYGLEVFILKGGYKVYRRFCIETLEKKYPIVILSGKTGTAKTLTLLEMKKLGEQVVDLEGIANHQGSSFGSMGIEHQPSQELFENLIAHELMKLNFDKRIWFENESIVIGKRVIPPIIFEQMRKAQIIDIQLPMEERIEFLNHDYGVLDKAFLIESVLKISKRLGPNETKLTIQAIEENRMKDFIKQVLVYYDKTYQRGQEKREKATIHHIDLDKINANENAKAIITLCNKLFGDK